MTLLSTPCACALIGLVAIAPVAQPAVQPHQRMSHRMDQLSEKTTHQRPSVPPLLIIHAEGNRLLAEIPRQSLGADFLVTLGLAIPGAEPGAADLGESGALRWIQDKDSLMLQQYEETEHGEVRYRRRAAFPILRFGADSAPVIEVGPMLADGQGGGVFMRALPKEGSAEQEPHQASPSEPAPAVPAAAPAATGEQASPAASLPGTLTGPVATSPVDVRVQVAPGPGGDGFPWEWDFWRLPTTPMPPRLQNPSVSYFPVAAHAGTAHYIERQRLEKRDPNAAVSDVVRPIVYRIDSTVPKQWVPWMKRGIEEWIPAFESIGFRHAIVVRDASSKRETTGPLADAWEIRVHWDPDRAEESASTDLNHIDPRSGEILYSAITFNAGVLPLMRRLAFLWTGATDPSAHYPYPDSVLGPMVQMIIAHEAGHSLGFDHHFNRKTAYPTDSIRSAAFVHRMGYTPSVMAYTYFNYVSQPEDHVLPNDLHMRVGPYDAWALAWGYRPIAGVKTPEDELPTLRRWLSVQDTAPYLRGARDNPPSGVDDLITEVEPTVVGNNPVKSADYGIRNLARIAPVVDAQRDPAAVRPESLVANLHESVRQRWLRELGLTIDVVGSVLPTSVPTPANSQVPAATPAPVADSVRQALHFLFAHVFYGQDDLVRQRVLVGDARRDTSSVVLFDSVAPGWDAAQWRKGQSVIIGQLFDRTGLSQLLKERPAQYTTLLPVLCTEFKALNEQLTLAKPTTPDAEAFRNELQGTLAKLLRATPPLCHE